MPVSRYYRADSIKTQLNAAVSTIDTSIAINGAANFPTSYPFTIIVNRDLANEEVMQVDSLVSTVGDVITYAVTRGSSVEPTITAQDHNVGSAVEHGVSARDFRESRTHEAAISGVHGRTGELVGTTDSQSISNKTFTTGNSVPQTAITGLSDALALKATLASPTFTGTVVLPATTSIGTVTNTEIGYLDGVTSNIQTQLNAAGVAITGAATTIVSDDLTANKALISNVSGKVAVATTSAAELNLLAGLTATSSELNVLDGVTASTAELNILDGVTATTAELNYVAGVTSAIQTQFTGKAAVSHTHVKGDITTGTIPTKMAAGILPVTFTSSNLGSASQSLTGFTVTPSVVGTSVNGQYNVAVTSVNSSNVTFTVRHIDNVSASDTINVHWIAVQV